MALAGLITKGLSGHIFHQHYHLHFQSPGGRRPKHVKPSGVGTNSASGAKSPPLKVEPEQRVSCFFTFSRSPNAAALQGTSCGEGRHCEGGLCVPKTLPQEGGRGGSSSGETFWESFSQPADAAPATSTATSSVETSTSATTSEPGRVVYFPKTFDICQFFAQFGITLNLCQR